MKDHEKELLNKLDEQINDEDGILDRVKSIESILKRFVTSWDFFLRSLSIGIIGGMVTYFVTELRQDENHSPNINNSSHSVEAPKVHIQGTRNTDSVGNSLH